MIQPEEKESLIELLGVTYSKTVLEHLNKKGVVSKSGTAHSRGFIRQVMNGQANHKEIEDTIFELAALRKAEKEARNKLLTT